MSFEEVLEQVGGHGVYQVVFVCLGLSAAIITFEPANMNFMGGFMEHWCHIPALENFTHSQQKHIGIPGKTHVGNNADLKYERCFRFPLDFGNYSVEELLRWNRSEMTDGIPKSEWISCDAGWTYDKSVWVSTINSQWDLVCGKSWVTPMASTLYMAGWFIGALLVGPISDRYGRRITLCACFILRSIGAFISLYAPNYQVFLFARLFLGVFVPQIMLIIFISVSEVTSVKWRAMAAFFLFINGSVSSCIGGLIAHFVRDNFYLHAIHIWVIVYALPMCLIKMEESPRWLISKGKEKEAIAVLKKIAAINRGTLPERMDFEDITATDFRNQKASYIDLLRTPNLRKKMMILGLGWFTASLVFWGLNLNAGRLPGNVFVNYIAMAAVDIPFRLISIPLFGTVGRKYGNAIAFLGSGVLMFSSIYFMTNEELGLVATGLSVLGKGLMASGFTGMFNFTAELAPTTIRNMALSFGSACARISGMAAPYVGGPLADVWVALPITVFGTFAVVSGSLILLLPETKGHNLPQTIEEGEAFGKKSATKTKRELPTIQELSMTNCHENPTANAITDTEKVSTDILSTYL